VDFERVYTDSPISDIFTRLEALASAAGARNHIFYNIPEEDRSQYDPELLIHKSISTSFLITAAIDYFNINREVSDTSKCLSYYYAIFSLLAALLVSDYKNKYTLKDIEKFTANGGHGIFNITSDEAGNDPFLFNYCAFLKNGFAYHLLRYFGYNDDSLFVTKKCTSFSSIDASDRFKYFTIKDLISRIPELRNIFFTIYHEQPDYLHLDLNDNKGIPSTFITVPFGENTTMLTPERISVIIDYHMSGLSYLPYEEHGINGLRSSIQIDKTNIRYIYDNLHKSIMAHDYYIKPLIGIREYLIFIFATFYFLSILVRYKSSQWLHLTNGENDYLFPIIQTLFRITERVFSNEMLNRLCNKRILFAPHSYL
jgi:hypothetical protein